MRLYPSRTANGSSFKSPKGLHVRHMATHAGLNSTVTGQQPQRMVLPPSVPFVPLTPETPLTMACAVVPLVGGQPETLRFDRGGRPP